MNFNLSSNRPRKQLRVVSLKLLMGAALIAAASPSPLALASCVNPGGTAGCYSTISAAVSAAVPGTTIWVASGTYKEDVVIGKTLFLIGADSSNTIIDATGLPNGVYIDGLDNAGLSSVLVSGFTIENANYEGLLITNASSVTIRSNGTNIFQM